MASAKKTFFAGGNLKAMVQATKDDAQQIFEMGEGIKRDLRRLETFPRPVVAAINGAALGGGYEITLACNHRDGRRRQQGRDRPARGVASACCPAAAASPARSGCSASSPR